MTDQEVYQELAREIGAQDSELIPRLFEKICNPVEARLLLAASPPKTVEELAKEVGLSEKDTEEMLAGLYHKGVSFKKEKPDGIRHYRVRNVMQFHDASVLWVEAPRDFLDLWKEHTEKEISGFWKTVKKAIGGGQPARVIPIGAALEHESQILAYEDTRALVEEASCIAVARCTCRIVDGRCGKPLEVCLQLGKGAEYAIDRGTGRKVSTQEALEIIKTAEEAGLVHISENQANGLHIICNCCSCCCVNWYTAEARKLKVAAPSRFLATVEEEICSGCGSCVEACPFDVIELRGGDEEKAVVDKEECLGCGVCAAQCPEKAILLKEIRKPDFVPGGAA